MSLKEVADRGEGERGEGERGRALLSGTSSDEKLKFEVRLTSSEILERKLSPLLRCADFPSLFRRVMGESVFREEGGVEGGTDKKSESLSESDVADLRGDPKGEPAGDSTSARLRRVDWYESPIRPNQAWKPLFMLSISVGRLRIS